MAKKANGYRPPSRKMIAAAPRVGEVDKQLVVYWTDPKPEAFVMPSILFDDMVATINRQRKALAQAQVVVNALTSRLRSRPSDDQPPGQVAGGTPQGSVTGTPP